jgi:type II secretory ATPase GspE/PulE/Tfp pilus assembly ATPase PilB-like protein
VTFAQGLRAVLRHDPDIIMVGEVRDVETAEIAIRSAMTGHLVLSTLHTNDAASTPLRLIEMGIEPFLVSSSLEGVVAQRLVRTLCPACKEKTPVSSSIFREEGLQIEGEKVEIFTKRGCEKCRFTGFRGRSGIFEVMALNEEIKDVIFRRGSSQKIKELAIANGMFTLRQDGLRKVLKGITTLNEVMRVTNQ